MDGNLPITARQEQFSLAYVRLVAAAAGCSIKCHETDYDGVDITISSSAEYDTFYCPEFELQLKCTTQQRYLTDGDMAWPMKAEPFARLTNPKRYVPAFLGVLLVPEDPSVWLDHNDKGLLAKGTMFWQRACHLGATAQGRGSRTVHLPRTNVFDVSQLLGIMRTIGEGGDL
ncbi:DUF4365 domain-containing protein [Streptacidiphilus carbonis]|uniref:DUF4365 domain-containing protein n=1 Tax=Streptacidiphilus carbonis TaxID=105422 RepID=UPI000A919E5F|nr:DUF4365 domain-containing protein [Streptacidiphilus carbonis]